MDQRLQQNQSRTKEYGGSLVEYALLVSLIAVVAIASAKSLGSKIGVRLMDTGDQIETAGTWNP